MVRKAYQGSKHLNKADKLACQSQKLKIFGLHPLPMQNPYSNTFLDIKFLFINFSNFLWLILGLKEY